MGGEGKRREFPLTPRGEEKGAPSLISRQNEPSLSEKKEKKNGAQSPGGKEKKDLGHVEGTFQKKGAHLKRGGRRH